MIVTFAYATEVAGTRYGVGDVADLPTHDAQRLVHEGRARAEGSLTPVPTPTTTEPPETDPAPDQTTNTNHKKKGA